MRSKVVEDQSLRDFWSINPKLVKAFDSAYTNIPNEGYGSCLHTD